VDLRDGGTRLGGFDVRRRSRTSAARLRAAIFGMDALEQADIDARLLELDGTTNMSKLGGNATVAVSLAVAQGRRGRARHAAVAIPRGRRPVSLPMPEVQIFGGGAHAGGASTSRT
jgi:enolase